MPPQPKRKLSKGRRDRRRAHDALEAQNLVQCSNCGEMCLPHTVCENCGHYKGREVVPHEEGKKKKK
jgi:large subunit ribosomal protein L32